jgi:hypothetical protein
MNKNILKIIAAIAFVAQMAVAQTVWNGMVNTTWYNTTDTEFTITTAEQLAGLAQLVNAGTETFRGKTITLGNDIALNDTTGWQGWATTPPANSWTAIGLSTSGRGFTGTFDGAGYVISGVYINNSSSYQGLFGYVGVGGAIKNLGVVASYIKGDVYVGGLVGESRGTITNSYATGSVSGTGSRVGGLVGSSYIGTLSNSYATGNVSGTGSRFGGLVGESRGTIITNSYAAGSVSGSSDVGGFVGYSEGSSIISSYYNSEASGAGSYTNSSGTPQTMAEMQSEEFTVLLNFGAYVLSASKWVYNAGKYPTLSNATATEADYLAAIVLAFEEGNGTENNPYIIKTKKHLVNLSNIVNMDASFTGKYIKLGNDIALNDTTNWQNWATTPPANSWTAIGLSTSGRQFTGFFDGAGYVISGVYINNSSSYQGLFGYVGTGGAIKNLGVVASYIKGNNYVGSLVGDSRGTITNSYATGSVQGSNYVGGLVGQNYSGSTIRNSYATGSVSGSSFVGGLVGESRGTITNSYATGSVQGSSDVGGLVGSGGTIRNSYATGNVTGSSNIGGLVGYYGGLGTISGSYYNSEASGAGNYTNSSGTPKTMEEMQSEEFTALLNIGAYLLPANKWVYNAGKYPTLSNAAATETDYLAAIASASASAFEKGSGTESNPYIVKTKEHLTNLSDIVNAGASFTGKYITLGNDISLNDTTNWQNWETTPPANSWTAIGTSDRGFAGTFDGAGHVVSGVYINNSSSYQGLFGYVGTGGAIKNLGVVASYIKGNSNVGGLVGSNWGTITNSYATGSVQGSGYGYVGGLVGSNWGTITNSYAVGSASGEFYVGGLVGYNGNSGSTITNSYAMGSVQGSSFVGGLVGYYYGTIRNSYATGSVQGSSAVGGLVGYYGSLGTISGSYYNSEASGAGNYTNSLGTPKTMAEMKQKATYVNWDFNEIWAISETLNNGYPFLRAIKFSYDMSAIAFSNKNVTYNGTAQSIFITGTLPTGVTVSYTGNGQTNVGTYTVTANFATTNEYYKAPASLTATLTIVEADKATCEANGKIWENDECREKTPQEVCLGTGKFWQGSTCWENEAEYIATLITACEADGNTWIDNQCKTDAQIAEETCLADGKVWENNTCREKTSQETCAEAGNTWIDNQCNTDAQIAQEACIANGKVWENNECREKTPQETCTEAGKFWQGSTCWENEAEYITTLITACEADGNTWIDNQCKTDAQIAQEACLANGKVWENNECREKTPQEVCLGTGKFWQGSTCWENEAEYITTLITACEADGKVWENDECRNKSTPIFANQENPLIKGIMVQTIGNAIMLSNLPPNAKIEVYNLQGKLVHNYQHSAVHQRNAKREGSSQLIIKVQTKGMYVIKINNQTSRVVVK